MNILSTIIPKSDQLNADDLIGGPKEIKITAVKLTRIPEQPLVVQFEGDNGRPWKPCKSMRRVLVALWGGDDEKFIGKRLILFCDPNVTFGGEKTGGIRVSHASGIDRKLEVSLTVKRGQRRTVAIEPLAAEKPANQAPVPISDPVAEVKARIKERALKSFPTLKEFQQHCWDGGLISETETIAELSLERLKELEEKTK